MNIESWIFDIWNIILVNVSWLRNVSKFSAGPLKFLYSFKFFQIQLFI